MDRLYIYMSNRLEQLLEELCDFFASSPPASPLEEEVIVVQSLGMRKWLSLELARKLGIWTNCRYPFPNEIVNEVFDKVLGPSDSADKGFFDRDAMTWSIMGLLPHFLDDAVFAELRGYLEGASGLMKLWQLSSRIANTFDQYLTYRTDMIMSWEKGNDDGWQARLWRALAEKAPVPHRARRHNDFLEALTKNNFSPPEGFPGRIIVFGIPSLPPFHLEILAALGKFIDVRVFFLNPCKEYWGDIPTPAEKTRILRKKIGPGISETDMHLETGNSLLASLGTLGRDFLGLLSSLSTPQFEHNFIEADTALPEILLKSLQDDILHMKESVIDAGEAALKDGSITISSCHGPMREVEVLRDYLISLFDEKQSSIAPDEVAVLTPDIEQYAPYIEAVFGGGANPPIPYTVADRSMGRESALASAFLSILDAVASRFEASRIVDILERPEVHSTFDIGAEELPMLRRWINETRIRWGFDGEGKSKLSLPQADENTWKTGLRRMFLGFAMPGNEDTTFDGILPYDSIEGNDALLLGKLSRFMHELHDCAKSLPGKKTLTEWQSALSGVLKNFIRDDDALLNDYRAIEVIIGRLGELSETSRFDYPVDFHTISAHLKKSFGEAVSSRNFLSGAVTFCAMLPMRSVPFKVICMIGMNDSSFPRQDRTPAFDLMARNPRPGDRSLREEDRYLFLEALISARERLYISYTGRSIIDDAEIPPSILVSELIDYIHQACKAGKDASIVTLHPLQPFSLRYYSDTGLFSYSEESCETAKNLHRRDSQRPFIKGPIREPFLPGAINLDELPGFFANPAKHLLRGVLGIHIPGVDAESDDDEPFEIDWLDRYQLVDSICRSLIAGGVADKSPYIKASGVLPHGAPGDVALNRLIRETAGFVRYAEKHIGGNALPQLDLSIPVSGLTITGSLDALWEKYQLLFRPATLKVKDLLRGWIRHLALSIARGPEHPSRTALISSSREGYSTKVFPEMKPGEASEILSGLIKLFLRGGAELLSFMPESSFAWAKKLKKTDDPAAALSEARKTWYGKQDSRGENADPYFELVFGRLNEDELFGEQFTKISTQVFLPILERVEDAQ